MRRRRRRRRGLSRETFAQLGFEQPFPQCWAWLAKCICTNCKTYLLKSKYVIVRITKTYLSKFPPSSQLEQLIGSLVQSAGGSIGGQQQSSAKASPAPLSSTRPLIQRQIQIKKKQKCKFKKYNRAVLRPCPHPTTHRFNKLKQNVLTDLPFKVENGLSKVMKCLGGKSLDLHRRQWERPTYALNSHTCLLRCKCEKSYLRHQALRMTYEAVFSHNYR